MYIKAGFWLPSNIKKLFVWNDGVDNIRSRLLIVIIVFILLYCIVILRLVIIASIGLPEKVEITNQYHERRKIIDREGEIIAGNIDTISLYAFPNKIKEQSKTAHLLSKILGMNQQYLLDLFMSGKHFVWIKRNVYPEIMHQIYEAGIVGVEYKQKSKRLYLENELFSHIIGYVDLDANGISGIEKIYDQYLNDTQNKDLQVTLDTNIQKIVSYELDKAIKKFNANGGVGIVVNPNNGELLALVSKPDFDPNKPGLASQDALFNKASLGLYEIGSVYKPIMLAIGLDTEHTTTQDVYNLEEFKIAKFPIKDWHKQKGWHSTSEIFIHSSNIGMAQIALEIGQGKYKHYLKKLLLTDKLPIKLQEKAHPIYPNFDSHWSNVSLVTMSYGYGSSITPLHFVQAMIPVINGGLLYPLKIIKDDNLNEPARVFQPSTSLSMRKLLRLTVKEGTGKKAELKGYLVGGKTGTAEKIQGKEYAKDKKRIASFVGIMPSHQPEYIAFIMIDEPKGIRESFGFAGGGWSAAPAISNIFKKIAIYKGMSSYNENDENIKKFFDIEYKVDNNASNYQREDH